ncbi:bacterial bifunctional deaminase-reductase [Phellopilus nigrolimitatus]|nr:bacterial bifunctional deaminase-reductase [Phellopilus nigrolimitatus]
MAVKDEIVSFLDQVLPRNSEDHAPVHITLTFAQSLDAKIAGRDGKQLILSCKESMVMTHRLRSRHDAILVGIGTALNDNPQLNTRLLAPDDGGQEIPLPVILDADLKFRLDSKLLCNYKANKGRQPTVFTSIGGTGKDPEWGERRERLEMEGVQVIPISSKNGKLDLNSLLSKLHRIGVHSLMVEGGASVISSFLQSGLVNSLVVTVCPTIVGEGGIGYDTNGEIIRLEYMQSKVMGRDTVMAWKASENASPAHI